MKIQLFFLAVAIAGVLGWGMNIVALIRGHESTGMATIRVIGILFPPLGSVMGYL